MSAQALVDLGQRYAAQGLTVAARSVLERALQMEGAEAAAAKQLAELAIATGDGKTARKYAQVLVKSDSAPESRILLGHAQLLAGELDGARFSFTAVSNQLRADGRVKARAMLGRARVAAAENDRAGAAANCMAALDELVTHYSSPESEPRAALAEISLIEDLLVHAVVWQRAIDAKSSIALLEEKRPGGPGPLFSALLLSARQAQGDESVTDAEVDASYVAAIAWQPEAPTIRLRRAERLLRRRFRDPGARADAMRELRSLADDSARQTFCDADVARLEFLLAAAYSDDPGRLAETEEAFRRGLALRPGHATAANELVRLILARGDFDGAVREIERALRVDAEHGLAWRTAARIIDQDPTGDAAIRILEAARPGAGTFGGQLATRLARASAEVARDEVLAGMHARGHRLKNLLSIVSSRARSARKLAGEGAVSDRLQDLETALTSLYSEWASYLRSMHTQPVIETVAVAAMVRDVVEHALVTAGDVDVVLEVRGVIPDMRGDRVLLSEALTNVVVNAVQACGDSGRVVVTVDARTQGHSTLVELTVTDTGVGIARADIARVFAPGYTTKQAGSGIGLAITERVVSAHQGRILVESEVGGGTVMRLVLPCDLMSFAT